MTWQLHPSANGRIGMASPQPPVEPAEAHDRKGRKREANAGEMPSGCRTATSASISSSR